MVAGAVPFVLGQQLSESPAETVPIAASFVPIQPDEGLLTLQFSRSLSVYSGATEFFVRFDNQVFELIQGVQTDPDTIEVEMERLGPQIGGQVVSYSGPPPAMLDDLGRQVPNFSDFPLS